MARDRVNIRIEIDQRTDADIRDLARSIDRSKRNTITVIVKNAVRKWKSDPSKFRELELVH